MSETRSEQNHGTGQMSQSHQHSRQGSFSSVSGVGGLGVMSPTSTRSGSNSPPTELDVRVGSSQTEEKSDGRNNQTLRKPKRQTNESAQTDDSHASAAHVQPVIVKENKPKFDLVSTMFPPLPGQLSSDSIVPVSINQSTPVPVHPVNLSAADIVRGVVSPKLPQQPIRTYRDSESSTELYDKGRNVGMDQNHRVHYVENSKKKEQASSTDDLPKSGREHGQDGRLTMDVSSERTSRVNSSAGTQTAALTSVTVEHIESCGLQDAAAQTSPPAKKADKRGVGSPRKSSYRKGPEEISATKTDVVENFHAEGHGELVVHKQKVRGIVTEMPTYQELTVDS